MNYKELVEVIAAETELPAGQVRKVGLAILEKFAGLHGLAAQSAIRQGTVEDTRIVDG